MKRAGRRIRIVYEFIMLQRRTDNFCSSHPASSSQQLSTPIVPIELMCKLLERLAVSPPATAAPDMSRASFEYPLAHPLAPRLSPAPIPPYSNKNDSMSSPVVLPLTMIAFEESESLSTHERCEPTHPFPLFNPFAPSHFSSPPPDHSFMKKEQEERDDIRIVQRYCQSFIDISPHFKLEKRLWCCFPVTESQHNPSKELPIDLWRLLVPLQIVPLCFSVEETGEGVQLHLTSVHFIINLCWSNDFDDPRRLVQIIADRQKLMVLLLP